MTQQEAIKFIRSRGHTATIDADTITAYSECLGRDGVWFLEAITFKQVREGVYSRSDIRDWLGY